MSTNHENFGNGYTGLALQSSSGWWCEVFINGRFVATTPANNKTEQDALLAVRNLASVSRERKAG